ncbi:putative sulfoacetate transporter SauU [subsurface metagenome]
MLAHFSHHVPTALIVPLLPFIRDDFVLDYTQSGLVFSAFALPYGISQLPSGWLADRLGPRILITISISGVALAGLLVGLSQTYIIMIAFLILMGVVGGGYHPSAPPLISASVKPKNRGRALGFHQIGGSASYFLTPLIGIAIATGWGWRGSFIGLAIPIIAFGIAFYVLLGRQVDTKRAEHRTTDSHDRIPFTPGRLRRLVAFIILSTFTSALIFSTIAFIPLFMVDHFGIGKETAAVFLAIIYSAGLWAGPLGGYLSDRLGSVPVILAVCLISGPVIYLLNLVPYGLGFGALLLTIGMIAIMRMPVAEAYIVGQTSERHRSTILGIYYFSGMEGGGILTPVIGSLIDRFGFYLSFTITGAALATVTLVCSIFLWASRDRPHSKLPW